MIFSLMLHRMCEMGRKSLLSLSYKKKEPPLRQTDGTVCHLLFHVYSVAAATAAAGSASAVTAFSADSELGSITFSATFCSSASGFSVFSFVSFSCTLSCESLLFCPFSAMAGSAFSDAESDFASAGAAASAASAAAAAPFSSSAAAAAFFAGRPRDLPAAGVFFGAAAGLSDFAFGVRGLRAGLSGMTTDLAGVPRVWERVRRPPDSVPSFFKSPISASASARVRSN